MANASDPVEINKKAKADKDAMVIFKDDLRRLTATDFGRRVFQHYIEFCGPFRTTFQGANNDAFRQEGMRYVGVTMLGDIMNVNPDAVTQIMKDSFNKEK